MQVVIKYGDSSETTCIFDHATQERIENVMKLVVTFEAGFQPMATLTLLKRSADGTYSDETEEITVFIAPNFD